MWYSLERREALIRAKIGPGKYECFICHNHTNKPDVDHIEPCGRLDVNKIEDFVARLFCKADKLQILCRTCHNKITKQQALKNKTLKQLELEIHK